MRAEGLILRQTCLLTRHCSTVTSLNLKSFEDIPGPPQLPLFGNIHLVMKKPHGFKKSWLNFMAIRDQHLTKDDKLMRMKWPGISKTGNVIILLDPYDVQKVHQHEGKYPNRGPTFEAFKVMRQFRQDIFHESTGVLTEDGERWHDIRSKVQQDLMRPKSALYYLDEVQKVGDEFVDFIRLRRSNEDQIIKNCLPEIYRYAFESICMISLDTRLGCLKMPMDPKLEKIFEASKNYLSAHEGLCTNPSWKFLPPRWNKHFRRGHDNLNILLDFGKQQVEDAKARIAKKGDSGHPDEMSILEKMIKSCGPESTYPLVTALDLIFAGIDTTGNTLGFLLYYLATNPEKQEKVRKECQKLGKNLTAKDLNELKYLRACIKETNRMSPTVAGALRLIPEEMELQGYHIPKDTVILWSFFIFQEQFPDHEKFVPERWLENKKDICPFLVLPFSHGARMCIGKRFAELELLTVTHKLMNNFEVKWMNPEPMTVSQVLVNEPDQSLDFQFNDLK